MSPVESCHNHIEQRLEGEKRPASAFEKIAYNIRDCFVRYHCRQHPELSHEDDKGGGLTHNSPIICRMQKSAARLRRSAKSADHVGAYLKNRSIKAISSRELDCGRDWL